MSNFVNVDCIAGSSNNVWKFVFEGDDVIYEAVLYRYESFNTRTVICVSVQSGCLVGCKFCGTGNRFIRDLNYKEIVEQVSIICANKGINPNKCKKFQVMFMSMGEPGHNIENVISAIRILNDGCPNAELLVSTVGVNNDSIGSIINLAKKIKKIGLQFSIHEPTDEARNKLIPFWNKLNINQLIHRGITFYKTTGKKVYLNFVVTKTDDDEIKKFCDEIENKFSQDFFCLTFSVLCKTEKSSISHNQLRILHQISNYFTTRGYNSRVFNPDGQDDIGGGCGQLFAVQEFFKNVKGVDYESDDTQERDGWNLKSLRTGDRRFIGRLK